MASEIGFMMVLPRTLETLLLVDRNREEWNGMELHRRGMGHMGWGGYRSSAWVVRALGWHDNPCDVAVHGDPTPTAGNIEMDIKLNRPRTSPHFPIPTYFHHLMVGIQWSIMDSTMSNGTWRPWNTVQYHQHWVSVFIHPHLLSLVSGIVNQVLFVICKWFLEHLSVVVVRTHYVCRDVILHHVADISVN